MNSKIKIKMGQTEIEYEGSETFLKESLIALISNVTDLYKTTDLSAPRVDADPTISSVAPTVTSPIKPSEKVKLSVRTIAAKLGGSMGKDVVLAAAAYLTIYEDKEVFKRGELLEHMKKATGFYKESFSGNLTRILDSLMSAGEIYEHSEGNYSLSNDKRCYLEEKLRD